MQFFFSNSETKIILTVQQVNRLPNYNDCRQVSHMFALTSKPTQTIISALGNLAVESWLSVNSCGQRPSSSMI